MRMPMPVSREDAHRIEFLNIGNAICSRVVSGDERTVTFDIIKIEDERTCQIYCPACPVGYIPRSFTRAAYSGLCLLETPPGHFSDDELDLIRTVTGLMATAMARETAEKKAIKTASLLTAALDSTTDGILVIDTDGKITSYNKTFCAMWGIPHHSLDAADEKTALAYMTPLIADPGSSSTS